MSSPFGSHEIEMAKVCAWNALYEPETNGIEAMALGVRRYVESRSPKERDAALIASIGKEANGG